MSFVHVIILGVIEGLTEFLPISSTFHLIMASKLLGLESSDFLKVFDVFIQAGAIFSVVIVLGREYLEDFQLSKKVLVSFVPTAVIGLVLHKVIKEVLFESLHAMLGIFVLVGLLFFWIERQVKKTAEKKEVKTSASPGKNVSSVPEMQAKVLEVQDLGGRSFGRLSQLSTVSTLRQMTYAQALLIGTCQALAVMPGVSRAGAVIGAMLLMKFSRVEATKYSFLLALPTIVAAAALDVLKAKDVLLTVGTQNIMAMGVGFVCAFISALAVTKWFLDFVKHRSLAIFGWYRVVVGVGLALFLFRF